MVAGLCALCFVYGFATRHSKLPPYETIRSAFWSVSEKPAPQIASFRLDPDEIGQGLETLGRQLPATRAHLRDRVILPEAYVDLATRDLGDDRREITASLYGLKIKSVLTSVPTSSRCLRIHVQGHGGDPFKFEVHHDFLAQSRAANCDVLSMSMLGLGLNAGDAWFPSGKYDSQITHLNPEEAERHGSYLLYSDKSVPEKDWLALFLSPHYHKINSLLGDYDDVSISGFSGGGWYAVWLAALLPEIDASIIYAGSLPLVYRTSTAFWGDEEEHSSEIYQDVDYWQLYFLGSHGMNAQEHRPMHFVFNSHDRCCFMDPAASHFESMAERLYPDHVEVTIDESVEHAMEIDVIDAIIAGWAKGKS
jgi:pimeloyl-ACP methyl ester carboxylesterase